MSSEATIDPVDLVRAHYEFQNGIFFSQVSPKDGAIFGFSRLTHVPMWNHAAVLDDSNLKEIIPTATQYFDSKGRRPVIYTLEKENPEAATVLKGHEFDRFDREAWMVFQGSALDPSGGDLQFVQAQSHAETEEFIKAFYAAYQVKDTGYGTALRSQSNDSSTVKQHFYLSKDNAVVSVATLIQRNGIGCIYNVGTPPVHRQKGYAAELLKRILNAVQESTRIFLQVECDSPAERLYKKLGFHTVFVRSGYRLRHWKRAETERPVGTQLSSIIGRTLALEGEAAGAHLRESFSIPAAVVQALNTHAGRTARGLESLFLAAWAALLHRYTQEEGISFTTQIQDRTVPVAVQIESGQTLADLAAKVRSELATPVGPSTSPGEILVRFASASQFLRQNEPASPLELLINENDLATVSLFFRKDIFPKEKARRLLAHFLNLLENFSLNPSSPVSALEILSPSERQQLLVEWNQTTFEPIRSSIPSLFENQVERTPDATALVMTKTGSPAAIEQLSYRQLNRRANRLAHRLQALGIGPEVMVGVCLERSLDFIVSLLAILKAGGVCVPLDPAYPTERLNFMVEDTAAPVVLTHSRLLGLFPELKGVHTICLDVEGSKLALESEKNAISKINPENAAYIIYTSGSTGQPKGVVVTSQAIANHCLDCKKQYGLSSKDRVLQFSSFNFDASFEQILPALLSGSALVLRDDEVWSTREFVKKLAEYQLTVADIPTAYWHQLVDDWHANIENINTHHLRMMIVGGEALSPSRLMLWQQLPIKGLRLINAYGPTETTITATSYEITTREEDQWSGDVVPIGRARADRKIYILDRYGQPTPIGVPGELHIGGPLLARGYHNRPELTGSRFIPNPFTDDADSKLYRTGDLARFLEDGNIQFLGRIDDQVKIRGFRIELGEIEAALKTHPAVRDALALAKPDSSGEKRLVAYVLAPAKLLDSRALRQFLKTKLPDYMVPPTIISLDEWPLMPNGKIDRRALPDASDVTETNDVEGPIYNI
jgi:amino acid adenylation domain-containing protein